MSRNRFEPQYLRSIARTAAALAAYADNVLASDPHMRLTFSQYLALTSIAHGAVTQADVARELAISQAAISRHMSILHTNGYITRHIKSDERRAHMVALTKRGAASRRLAEQLLTKAFHDPLHTISASARASVLKTLQKTTESIGS